MAADEYTVQTVGEYWPNLDVPCWYVDMLKPDGSGHRHVFPQYALEQRAAEYGIDPGDVDTLLDMVLHEPYAPDPADPGDADEPDPAGAEGMLSPALVSRGMVRKGDLVPTTLYTASDTRSAREAHLLRIEHAKAHRVKVVAPKAGRDPLNTIRQAHGIDPARVAEKAAEVEERRLVAQGRAPAPKNPDHPKGGTRA